MEERQTDNKKAQEIKAVVCLALGVFLFLCLISYHPHDPSFTRFVAEAKATKNFVGPVGSYISDSLIRLLGIVSFLLPFICFFFSFQYFFRPSFALSWNRAGGLFFFAISFAGLMQKVLGQVSFYGETLRLGGLIGATAVELLLNYFNIAGTYILLVLIIILSLIFTLDFSLVWLGEKLWLSCQAAFRAAKNWLSAITASAAGRLKEKPTPQPAVEEKPPTPKKAKLKKVEQTHFDFTKANGKFQLPSFNLLEESQHKDARVKRDQLVTNSRILERKLSDFGVQGRVVDVLPGPVITMYELEPASGVKINRITNLADDLALALMAPSIRIIAPIPGKSVIGIEIPNLKREQVFLKDVLNNESFTKSTHRLPIALGVDFVGTPIIADMTKMPHLLIAGTTGSGKSVALNAMICSILFKATPDDVKFLMIDPKRLELSSYEGIPHLLHPVVVDPKKASQVLRWTVEEMERR